MAEDEIQAQPCKFPRVLGNGRNDPKANNNDQYPDNEIDGQLSRRGTGGGDGGANRFNSWHHHSSRIIRVSRASGGKDRHSKVMTSKGLRDRRVRLSVTTAIQFYDLQDRLGYDQPSKAVEWLIKAAQDAIAELPSLNTFPESPTHPTDDKRASVGAEQGLDSAEIDGDGNYQQNQSQNLSLSKSACSSTSETSKGSGLSLSRSEMRVNRVKARERARERAAKEKEKESETRIAQHRQNVNPISQTASFTELLTGGIGTVNPNTTNNSPTGSVHQNQNHPNDEANFFNKGARQQQWTSTTMDYFSPVIWGSSSSSSRNHHHQNSGFPGQIQLGNALNPQTMSISPFNVTSESQSDQLQHFSFIPDHLIPVVSSQPGGGGDYSLNFSISSSGLAGFNRGTLQSNSPSLLPHHLQRFSPIDGSSNVPFFIGAAASATPTMENHTNHHHHQFSPAGFDGRGLQLCYGDGSRHSDQKGKGKN